jgi:hypothetical protein
MKTSSRAKYFVCVNNEGYAASLETRKIYRVLPDALAERHGMVRVIDESGEDYLYPAACFVAISLSPVVRQALKLAA